MFNLVVSIKYYEQSLKNINKYLLLQFIFMTSLFWEFFFRILNIDTYLEMFMESSVITWYMYTIHNDQIRVTSISISSNIYHLYMLDTFGLF